MRSAAEGDGASTGCTCSRSRRSVNEKSKVWSPIENSCPAGTWFTNAILGLSGERLSDRPISAATSSG
jgi:hypothetical protein